MAVWSQAWYIVYPLVCVIFGHWSLLLHGMSALVFEVVGHATDWIAVKVFF